MPFLEAFGDDTIDDSAYRNADGSVRYTPEENEIWHHQHQLDRNLRWNDEGRAWASGDVLITGRRDLLTTDDPTRLHWQDTREGGIPYVIEPNGQSYLLFSSLTAWRNHVEVRKTFGSSRKQTILKRLSRWFASTQTG